MTAFPALLGATSHGTALWYLTRSTGLVSLVLLTATVVLGVVASVGWTTERWPRFLSQGVHRNLSLFCVGFVAIHVVTTVSDGYVPIGFADAFIPFRTPYRPLYVGLGALCFDLLLAVLVTSALRHRIGFASWRFVHWLAYLCWPIAMFHSLGSGSDSRLGVVLALDVLCAVAVFGAVFWRLVSGRTFPEGRRAMAAVGTVVVGLALLVFAALGPLRPGWSHRSGTSSALLAQLAQKYSGTPAVGVGIGTGGQPHHRSGQWSRAHASFHAGGGRDPVHLRSRQPRKRAGDALHASPERGIDTADRGAVRQCRRRGRRGHVLGNRRPGLRPGGGDLIERGHDYGLPLGGHAHGPHGDPPGGPELRWPVGDGFGHGRPRGQRGLPLMATGLSRSSGRGTGATVEAPFGVERLLIGVGADAQLVSLGQHLSRWGDLPDWRGSSFLDELERSGLRGQGGAWFPLATKWRSLRPTRVRGPVVVANGAEGEPASGKDRLLVHLLPHLVLDGAAVAARTLGASQVYVHVHADAVGTMRQAIAERQRHGLDPVVPEVVVAPERYLAGQESAVVNTIGGRATMPYFTGIRTVRDQGVAGRPTLVQNVESLAHVALIARFGATWFRSVGTPDSPGTSLLTVTGRWRDPRIVEAPLGMPLGHFLGLGAGDAGTIQGVLLGGYGGGWLQTTHALAMPLTEEDARRSGSSLGAGVVALLPSSVCSVAEVARVVRYMDGQKAGQCGPCVNGLDGLARSLELLAYQPGSLRGGVNAILALCDLVDGRGACGHPDGVARFVRSGLRVFSDHAQLHLQRGPCRQDTPPFLPVPAAPVGQGVPVGSIGAARQRRSVWPDGSVRASSVGRTSGSGRPGTARSSNDGRSGTR